MPGSMVHLLAAERVNPRGSALFLLGNIAPDAVADWHDKDITHFRNLADRRPALKALAHETAGDFAEGVLLHLFVDWKWDTTVRQDYIDKSGDDWFSGYRNELSLSGSYAFHHTDWATGVWQQMDSLAIETFGETPCASAQEVKDFVRRNHRWHIENAVGPSLAFPPSVIDRFTAQVANEYIRWRAGLK